MEIEFSVGQNEVHKVKFKHDKTLTGMIYFFVDDKKVMTSNHMIGMTFSKNKDYSINIGSNEKHEVKISISRPLVMATFKDWTYQIFIDDKLADTRSG